MSGRNGQVTRFSDGLCVCMPACHCVRMYVCMYTYLSVCLSVGLCLSVCLSKDISFYGGNTVQISVQIAGGVGGLNPPTSSCRPPYLWSKFDPGGSSFNAPHLSLSEVGMLLDSHFLTMQFLKYLQCDDLNVTTILIHIEDYGLFSLGLSVKFY